MKRGDEMRHSVEPGIRALLVSDDPPTIEQLSDSLKNLAASTHVCTDVQSAIRLLSTRKFETVVVDLELGEQAGVVLERVRLSPSNRTTVAFAITSSTQEAAKAFNAGSNFVLERPLSTRSVGRTLQIAYGLIIRERLRYFRCAVSLPGIYLNEERGKIDCCVVNVSEGGLAITTPVALKPGSGVCVQFRIPGGGTQFAVQSEVCWHDEKGRAGLRFVSPSPEQIGELREWLSKQLETSLPRSVAEKFRTYT